MSLKDAMVTNWRKVKEGWRMLAVDWGLQNEKMVNEWGEGNYGRAIFHTLSGYQSALLRFPYRTWSYLWEVKWLTIAALWVYLPPPNSLVNVFLWVEEVLLWVTTPLY